MIPTNFFYYQISYDDRKLSELSESEKEERAVVESIEALVNTKTVVVTKEPGEKMVNTLREKNQTSMMHAFTFSFN